MCPKNCIIISSMICRLANGYFNVLLSWGVVVRNCCELIQSTVHMSHHLLLRKVHHWKMTWSEKSQNAKYSCSRTRIIWQVTKDFSCYSICIIALMTIYNTCIYHNLFLEFNVAVLRLFSFVNYTQKCLVLKLH